MAGEGIQQYEFTYGTPYDSGRDLVACDNGDWVDYDDHIKAVAEAVAKEREACAARVDRSERCCARLQKYHSEGGYTDAANGALAARKELASCADAIRARNESKGDNDGA